MWGKRKKRAITSSESSSPDDRRQRKSRKMQACRPKMTKKEHDHEIPKKKDQISPDSDGHEVGIKPLLLPTKSSPPPKASTTTKQHTNKAEKIMKSACSQLWCQLVGGDDPPTGLLPGIGDDHALDEFLNSIAEKCMVKDLNAILSANSVRMNQKNKLEKVRDLLDHIRNS